jgi:hypothetical protein
MPDQDKQNPGTESDISKAQSQQQPPQQASQEPATGQQSRPTETAEEGAELSGDQAATGQAQTGAGPDEGLQGDTLAQQRTDIEGGSLASEASGKAKSGFVGAEGEQDSSAELVEDQNFKKDGQGAPEGK